MNLDKFDAENQAEFAHGFLLVGEGKADISFLMQLCQVHGIPDLHFGFPTDLTGGFGLPGFGKYLGRIPTKPGFKKLRAVMVFYDNDTNAAQALNDVIAQVAATDPYSLPTIPNILGAPQAGKVRLMVVPMPRNGDPGALETLLLESASADAAGLACVDSFVQCVPCAGWTSSHESKMRLRSLIAARCKGNSDMTLTHIWGKPGNPIDLNHACFSGLVDLIRGVVASA